MTIPHVAISVGHRKGAQGARHGDLTEWLYNSVVAEMLKGALSERGLESVVVFRPDRASYRGSRDKRVRVGPYMRQVEAVAASGALVAIDLHLNAAESKWARGRLFLSSGSEGSLLLGSCLRTSLNATVPAQDRGIEVRSVEQNGGPFLHLPPMPCILLEPWFLSNSEDRQDIVWYQAMYVEALADGLVSYFSTIGAL